MGIQDKIFDVEADLEDAGKSLEDFHNLVEYIGRLEQENEILRSHATRTIQLLRTIPDIERILET